jgi:hypothetical protein
MTSKVKGGCFCGHVRFEVAGPERFACFCHCESCQRAAGAPVVAWATYVRDSFDIVQGRIRWHQSSPGVTRGFCSDCGASITYENDKRSGEIDITLCCLDEPDKPLPRAHIWTEDRRTWLVIGDDLPVYKRNIG